jgi:hypothetical protein
MALVGETTNTLFGSICRSSGQLIPRLVLLIFNYLPGREINKQYSTTHPPLIAPLKSSKEKVKTYPLSTYITEGRQSQYSIFDRT